MKQRAWAELQEDCSRKGRDSCYLLTSCATDLPDMSRRWSEHQTFSTTWGCSTSESITLLLSKSLQRHSKKRQLQTNTNGDFAFFLQICWYPFFLPFSSKNCILPAELTSVPGTPGAEKRPIIQSSYFSQASNSPAAAESQLQAWQPSRERSSGSLLWHRLGLGGLGEDWRNETYIRLCDN